MTENRLSERNAKIAEMLEDGEQLKNFYRFIAQNPYILLHDACQIIIERPDAVICNTMDDWNAMGRRVTKGRKGIPYFDKDGFKQFVFDVRDTHGDDRYQRDILPLRVLLKGLDELNGTSLFEDGRGDYRKIHSGVYRFLEHSGELTGDEQRDALFSEGVAFCLYCKTGFPKTANIHLHGLPYSYRDNAAFVKEMYIRSELFTQEVSDAYEASRAKVEVIDDTEEEVITDEPRISGGSEQEPDEKAEQVISVSPYYRRYLDAQKKDPQAIVLIRLGDFYEVMGDNARTAAEVLDLTLTSRDVGLTERVPMCGFPYYVSEIYTEKLVQKHSVIILEDGKEPVSLAPRSNAAESEQQSPQPEDRSEDLAPFDEQSEEAEEDDFDEDTSEQDEPEEAHLPIRIQGEKGIKDRKRRHEPQLSMFDLLEPQEKNEKEQLIERSLKYGSGMEHGKFRIYDKYQDNPPVKEFVDFLKREYGIGGHGGWGGDEEWHDSKGIQMSVLGEKGETLVEAFLKWPEVAVRIADLIDDDSYFYEQEKKKYAAYSGQAEGVDKRLEGVVSYIVDDGTKNTSEGSWVVYFDEFGEDEQFVRDNAGEIVGLLSKREEVADVELLENGIDLTFYLDYCSNLEIDDQLEEWDDDEKDEQNTELSSVLDQADLGGAKTRFRNNVAAIRLVNRLYAENAIPTAEEKKTLARFVGWGGLAQAFDESNESWKKEYDELKSLLPKEDYDNAKSSTLNAYYTPKEVIEGIYTALERFGVKGNNRILEPAMGTGNFFGFMPKGIADGSRLYGVELDNLTGKIATKLYPQANIQIKGFEDTTFPNDKFDIVVGNVPFGGYGVADSDYNRYNFKVHDYFLAKSVDKTRTGGIVAVITSKGTMDKLNPSARRYVAERAELLGAIRLPNNAFKQMAGTEAVADILFFRKREEKIPDLSQEAWLGTGKTAEGYEINNYFLSHPQMILGTLAEEHGLYGGIDTTVKPDGRALQDALAEAIKNLPESVYLAPQTPPEDERESEVDYNVKPFCYKAEGGRLYMRIGDEMVEQIIPKSPKDAYQRIQGMIGLREELHHILDIQIAGCSDDVLEREQWKLNSRYDLFVKEYGNLNSQTNSRLFKDDGDSALLFAAENVNEETKAVTKADVFFKRTIRPYVVPTSTDDPFEALQISQNERGKVDLTYIEELTGKPYEQVIEELGNAIFRDPEKVVEGDRYSGFVTNEEYLSGQVVNKLERAKEAAESHPEYQKNVDALLMVQPDKLTASDISVRLGATWVDKGYYKQFYCELLGVPWYLRDSVELMYNPHDSSWRLDQRDNVRHTTDMRQKEVYGTKRAPAYRLFVDALNLKSTTITDLVEEDGKEKRVVNQAETIAAREKQNKIKEAFADWIFKDPERRADLEETYNRLFNQTRLPSYDGSYLKFPEMNPAIELKPHQKNAVHRIITSDKSTLLHHVVGAGKTFTVVASIMKMRQLGLCKKAMVTCPNHLVQQWAGEWRKLYPNAHILVATKEDLEKDNRRKFVSKIAIGDWDGIIIAQSSFAKIPISQERQVKKLKEEIAAVEATIQKQWEENGMPRGAVKNLETIKKGREKQLKKLMDASGKDDVLKFEDLGVDYLFVDEAHSYKNLFLFTKMNNVAGISTAASQRASDLKLKCEYLQEIRGSDRGVVFATGTPISNSMTEMYTMQTYLQPSVLKELGMTFFDGWAADFGETITSMELSPSGQGYRAMTRFAKFTNLPELLKLYRSFADVQTSDMVKLDVPEAERQVISLKPSDTTIELAEEIAERADRIHDGHVDPHEDNMLKITSDGKKLALDPRCFVPESQDEEGSKLNECAQRIFEVWTDTKDRKGTQIVFCDLSTPKVRFEDYEYGKDFDAYNDLKYKLVRMGIPQEEIAYIHEANTDEQKQALFDKVNSGAVRVLLGSTEKCGAGTNVQKRLVALHHLDTPYRPSDMEQREGRIIRQGNTNEKVKIFTYVTERTFDSYSYQILENKQRFISQINRGDLTVREAEDIDETTLSYAEIKAITAANPKIKRKMEVDAEVARLRVLEGQYRKNLYALQDKIYKAYPEEIRKQELLIERIAKDLEMLKATHPADPEAFEISVNGKVYKDRKEGGKALTDALYSGKDGVPVAEYCGFKIAMKPMTMLMTGREVILTAEGQYEYGIGDSPSGNLTRIENFFDDLPGRAELLKKGLEQLHADLKIAKKQVEKPFEQAERLKALLFEQAQLNAELNLDKRDEVIVADEEEGEEQYKAVPETINQNWEVNMIDEDDKVAAMKVDLLPDYAVTQEDMHAYGALFEERGSILQGLYNDYIGDEYARIATGSDTAEFIMNYCERHHASALSSETTLPYLRSAAYAREHGELEEFRRSRKLNEACRAEIDDAISKNFDGMHLKEGFEKDVIEKYGRARVNYILATTIREHAWDGRYSPKNRAWAESIPISESESERANSCLHSHPAIIDGMASMMREYEQRHQKTSAASLENTEQQKEENLAENRYLKQTARGDKVMSIAEDRSGRNIAVVQRKNDYTVAIGYDTSDGTWAQGVYDFKDEKAANDYRERQYGKNCEPPEKWYEVFVSKDALIKTYNKSSLMRMPTSNKEYAGYTYYVFNNRMKESRQPVDRESDSPELCYKLLLTEGEVVHLRNRDGDEVELTAEEFSELVNHTSDKDYTRENKPRLAVNIPRDALIKTYESSSLYRAPNTGKYEGYAYYLPNSVVGENVQAEDGSYTAQLPEDFTVTLRKGEDEVELSAREFQELVANTSSEDYKRPPSAMDEYREQYAEEKVWSEIPVSEKAVIANYERSVLLRMPKGNYEGMVYYIPAGMVRKDEDGIRLRLPEDFEVHLKNGTDEKLDLSVKQLMEELAEKTDEDYESIYRRPSEEARKAFERVEHDLRTNLPEEIKEKPNWVVVRTKENKDTGRLEKFLIDVHTGKFAESDNPETWTDFDTACEYAKEHGGVALAYALDGKDNIACIDLDHCIGEDGERSPLAEEVLSKCGETYIERSLSGKGIHVFGKTKGSDLRSFSKEGDMEYYQGGRFIAMTGDGAENSRLESLDTPEMKEVLERKLERRTEWKNIGKGEAGLTQMEDHELLEKAFSARNGDTVRRLYNGEDLRHNHSNSDMSLMNYLAFYSGGNVEQMTRIFATSGLYRSEKHASYYEHTAIKAAKDTPHYTPPKAPASTPKSSAGNSKA